MQKFAQKNEITVYIYDRFAVMYVSVVIEYKSITLK
jgi:hypothetical protein